MRKTASAMPFLEVLAIMACVTTLAWGSSARADGSSRPYGQGGTDIPIMRQIVEQYNKSGELFRIEGECRSSCTLLLAIKNVCIDPIAGLEFHAALRHESDKVVPARNAVYASFYNSRLRSFVLANHYMDSWTFHLIPGEDMIQKFGYRRCPGK